MWCVHMRATRWRRSRATSGAPWYRRPQPGRYDLGTPLEAGEFIAQHIPNARLAVLETAHIANVEQPKIYGDTVMDFLLGK